MKRDVLDRKILYQLDCDARQPLSQLARALHVSRERIQHRYDRLIDEGLIKQSTVTLNPYKLGLTIYKTYLKVSKGSARYEDLLRYLNAHPQVYWIAECDGRWDLIYALFARTPFEFHQLQQEIFSKFRETIVACNVYTLVNVWMYGKNYLVGGGKRSFLVGGEPGSYQIDSTEWKILGILSQDARRSIPEVAREVSTTEMVVRHRLKKLEEAGVVAGYRVELDYVRLGMMFFKAQLYLNACSKSQERELQIFCAEHPNVTYYIQQIGECELELELEVENYQEFTSVINQMRAKFSSVIRNVETVLIHRAWFKWVPYRIFSQN